MGIRISTGIGPIRVSIPLTGRGRRGRYATSSTYQRRYEPYVEYSERARQSSWWPVIAICAIAFVGAVAAVIVGVAG